MIDLPQYIYDLMLDRLSGSIGEEDTVRLQQWLDMSEEHLKLWKDIAEIGRAHV